MDFLYDATGFDIHQFPVQLDWSGNPIVATGSGAEVVNSYGLESRDSYEVVIDNTM
jgi:hypothetical protein